MEFCVCFIIILCLLIFTLLAFTDRLPETRIRLVFDSRTNVVV